MEWVNNIHLGNAIDVLKTMPDDLVDCVVTSPPYWGLRDYGTPPVIWESTDGIKPKCDHQWGAEIKYVASGGHSQKQDTNPASFIDARSHSCVKCGAWRGQLGLEPRPEMYVEHLVSIFREVRRILKPTGTVWLNIGDSYMGSNQGAGQHSPPSTGFQDVKDGYYAAGEFRRTPLSYKHPVLKGKDMCGIPWRVALALQEDGWYLRCDVIWCKPNPMPESCRDRPTQSHEYIFLLTKSPKYFFDQDAVREPLAKATVERAKYNWCADGNKASKYQDLNGLNRDEDFASALNPSGHNIRSVWSVTVQPYREAHFATFPEELAERCIKAGSSETGCCPKCGAPYERITEKKGMSSSEYVRDIAGGEQPSGQKECLKGKGLRAPSECFNREVVTLGWQPTCECFGHFEETEISLKEIETRAEEEGGGVLPGHAAAAGDRGGPAEESPGRLSRRTDPGPGPRRVAPDAESDPVPEPGQENHRLLLLPSPGPGPENLLPDRDHAQREHGRRGPDRRPGQRKTRIGRG